MRALVGALKADVAFRPLIPLNRVRTRWSVKPRGMEEFLKRLMRLVTYNGSALSSPRPDTERDSRSDHAVHEGRRQTGRQSAHAGSRLKLIDASGRSRLICQPSSRTGENPPYGMIGRIEETSASFEARSAPRSHPTKAVLQRLHRWLPLASFSRRTVERSFFRKPGLAQAIDNNGWGRRLCRKPFDCELRVETTRLRQSQFRLGVVHFRGLSSSQKGVGKIGRVSRGNGTLKLLDRRVKPTPAKGR